MLGFLISRNSPFMINPYPFFGCSEETLDYALFRPKLRGSRSEHQASLHQHARRPARRSLLDDEIAIGFLLVRNCGRPRSSAGDGGTVDRDQFGIQRLEVENNNEKN
ncbi:unnamed protein product [Linum tenue]|uniref:Uncharacterized protein n=2 Tax=Linum tenue TaxID=586396 RepID=A0AAV0LGZ2_9ROSI|nr:unnamed protein product [Linum tenue]